MSTLLTSRGRNDTVGREPTWLELVSIDSSVRILLLRVDVGKTTVVGYFSLDIPYDAALFMNRSFLRQQFELAYDRELTRYDRCRLQYNMVMKLDCSRRIKHDSKRVVGSSLCLVQQHMLRLGECAGHNRI